jgi:hypothetical protein
VANPFAAEMRAQLVAAHRRLDAAIDNSSADPVNQLVVDLRSIFADAGIDYARLCARLFDVDPRPQ